MIEICAKHELNVVQPEEFQKESLHRIQDQVDKEDISVLELIPLVSPKPHQDQEIGEVEQRFVEEKRMKAFKTLEAS